MLPSLPVQLISVSASDFISLSLFSKQAPILGENLWEVLLLMLAMQKVANF